MFDGFLGTRASLVFDLLVVALAGVLAALVGSILLARWGKYRAHRTAQTSIAAILLVSVVAFEADLWLTRGTPRDWRLLASESSLYETWVYPMLGLHLVFAIVTPVLWAVVLIQAWRKFPRPPAPAAHSRRHRLWGYVAAVALLLTTLTGWAFYVVAFVV